MPRVKLLRAWPGAPERQASRDMVHTRMDKGVMALKGGVDPSVII